MPDDDVSPLDIARRYIAGRDHIAGLGPEPLGSRELLKVWERWWDTTPDKAWAVYEDVVRLRPDDDDVLEGVWNNLQWMLEEGWDSHHERVIALVRGNARLKRIAPPEQLESSYYWPNYRTPGELAVVWLVHSHHTERAHAVEVLARENPDRGLTLALELIHHGPRYGFRAYDLMHPLLDLLRRDGSAIIDRVEDAASRSVAVRRVLWRFKAQQGRPPGPHDIPPDIWTRVVRAIGDTTDYSSDEPTAPRPPQSDEADETIESWFVYEYTFWAWETLDDLTDREPEYAWEVIEHLVALADEDSLGAVGAGPLEGLLRRHSERFVDRVEAWAAADDRFRTCLGSVWLSTHEMRSDLLTRLVEASAGELQVLEREVDPKLSDFDKQILETMLAGDDPLLDALRAQITVARASDRMELFGSYTVELSIPPDVSVAIGGFFTIADVAVELHFVQEPATCWLDVDQGRLVRLNCQVTGDDWPSPTLVKRVYYTKRTAPQQDPIETPDRDMVALRRKWQSDDD